MLTLVCFFVHVQMETQICGNSWYAPPPLTHALLSGEYLRYASDFFTKKKSFGAVAPSAMIFIHLHEQIVCTNESLLCTVLSYLRYACSDS